jgi:hypothetical protein
MTFVRLPESVQSLYAELLDQLRIADAEAAVDGLRGSFVSKEIRGRTYWYVQKSEGARKRQIYLGAESPELLDRMRAAAERRSGAAADETRRRELVAMLAAGGMFRESASFTTVIRVLADASVFRAGGVLVGTQAFRCLGNMLGVSFEEKNLRTADIDVAQDTTLLIGLDESRHGGDLLARLRATDPAFFAVPGLDPREPSTSFKVRGRDLRVDFLIPDRSHGRKTQPVFLPHLGIAAQPLGGLDYLIDEAGDAVLVGGSGTRVNVPFPGRFAFHKLWVAGARPASEATKSKKDIRQAAQILDVLIDDRPQDVTTAYEALSRRRGMLRGVRSNFRFLDGALMSRLEPLIRARTSS